MSEARLSACQGQALALAIGVFAAGLASGAIGMRVYEQRAAADVSVHAVQAELAVDELRTVLHLDEQQAERVRMILDESIMAEADLLSQIRFIQQEGRSQILEVLDLQQRSQFEAMVQRVSND